MRNIDLVLLFISAFAYFEGIFFINVIRSNILAKSICNYFNMKRGKAFPLKNKFILNGIWKCITREADLNKFSRRYKFSMNLHSISINMDR